MKIILTILFLISVQALTSQVTAVFPATAKGGIKKVILSPNDHYAVLSDAYYDKHDMSLVVYDLISREPVKNIVTSWDEALEPIGIDNSGKYISFTDNSGYGYYQVLDIEKNIRIENNPSDKNNPLPSLCFSNQDAIAYFFPNNYWNMDHGKYWFTKQYAVSKTKEELVIYDSIEKKEFKYPKSIFKGLNNYYVNELSVSANGKYLAYQKGKKVFLVDLTLQEMICYESLDIIISDIAVFDDGILCIAGKYGTDASYGLHYYNPFTLSFLTHSTDDELQNITYSSQFYRFVSIGTASPRKKKVEKSQYIDLSNGLFSDFKPGKGWGSFNEVQKFVKDTLCRQLLTSQEFDSINSKPVYYSYFLMEKDYKNESGNYAPSIENPQVSADFFDLIDSLNWNIEVRSADANKVTFQNTSGDLAFFGVFLKKKLIYFWNGNKTKPEERMVKLFITKDNSPVFFTDDSYYFCPEGLSNAIGFEKDMKYYPAEQFDLKYNRPDIILDRLGYADSSLVAAYHQAYLKRLKKMGFTEEMLKEDFHLPEIEIENYESIPTIIDQNEIELNLYLKDDKYPLDRINIWVNDVAVLGTNGISLRNLNSLETNKEVSVPLAKGKNKIQISVLNQAGAESYKESFEIECSIGKDQPDLYLITIGESEFKQSDFNLKYAAKDAKDIANLFSSSSVYHTLFTKTLTNEQVTKENIKALKSFLAKADINDHVIVFIAGHGVLSADLDYYLATYDIDFNQPEGRGLMYEELESLLDGIRPLSKTLIIDACHSGEIDKEEMELAVAENTEKGNVQFRAVNRMVKSKLGGQNTMELTKSLFTDLRKGTGATVISSAGGMEFAMESGEWQNGLFTYVLLNGIKSGEADLNGDQEIWLSELQQYVGAEVARMSNGLQQPTSRIENQTIDFRIW